jgi:hypothetical protein
MTEEMIMAEICQKMGWDFFTYWKQPDWFLELLKLKFEIESKQLEKENNKLNKF